MYCSTLKKTLKICLIFFPAQCYITLDLCSNTSQTFPKSRQILRTQDRSISRKDSCEIHWRMYIKLTSLKFNAKWWTETMNRTENLTSWGLTFHTCYTISIAVNKSGFQNLYWSRRKFLERKRSLLRCSPDELIKLLIDASLNINCFVITDYVNWKRATFEWREFLRKLSAAWTHSVQNNNQSMNWWSCIVISLDSIRGEHSTKFSAEVFVPLHHSDAISHRKLYLDLTQQFHLIQLSLNCYQDTFLTAQDTLSIHRLSSLIWDQSFNIKSYIRPKRI